MADRVTTVRTVVPVTVEQPLDDVSLGASSSSAHLLSLAWSCDHVRTVDDATMSASVSADEGPQSCIVRAWSMSNSSCAADTSSDDAPSNCYIFGQ